MPSTAEGFWVAAVEAMAAGHRVVASDIPVFREVVGDCGIFFNPSQPAKLAAKLTALVERDSGKRHVDSLCKERARERFSLDRAALEYAALYEELVDES
jgi:glycosyltransferase involved in cell wall biosynthesis